LLKSDAFKDGAIVGQFQKTDHSYICGDASNCYNKAKVKKFLRHVTFILDHPHKSAVSLLVLDEIELLKDGLAPKFLLHSTSEPVASARDRAASRNTVTIEQGAGRLIANFLTPVTVEKIGGPGKEWLVNGTNYPPQRPGPPHIPGAWRIEATPSAIAPRTFRILTLLTPMDLSAPIPPAPQLAQTSDGAIVRQGGLTVALYRKTPPIHLTGDRKVLIKLA
jgi:hypothetical protein